MATADNRGTRDAAPAPGSLEGLRASNRARVIAVLREPGTLTRAEVARRTGLSRSTVSTVVADLIDAGIVREGDEPLPGAGAGRPGMPLRLDATAGAALGISLQHDGVHAIVTDLAHRVLAEHEVAAPLERMGADDVARRAADAARAALDAAGVPAGRLVGTAASVPSPVDPASGVLGAESVIPSIAGRDIAGPLSALLGTGVRAENDTNLCVLAEHIWGARPGHRDMLYLKLSRGIGAGLLLGGAIYRGAHGGAGELGHTPIVPEGPPCRCGNRGCLETVAGTGPLVEQVAVRLGEGPRTVGAVVELALAGDTVCRRALRDVGSLVGTALASTVNLLNPDLLVIGGEMGAAFTFLEGPIREAMDRAAIHRSAEDAIIVPGSLGRRAEALGAVALVLRESADVTLAGAAPPRG
ncbi:MAG: ROK family protein [Thermoleophilia bacterium]